MASGAEGAKFLSRTAKKAHTDLTDSVARLTSAMNESAAKTKSTVDKSLENFADGIDREVTGMQASTALLKASIGHARVDLMEIERASTAVETTLARASGRLTAAAASVENTLSNFRQDLETAVVLALIAVVVIFIVAVYTLIRFHGTEIFPKWIIFALITSACSAAAAIGAWVTSARRIG